MNILSLQVVLFLAAAAVSGCGSTSDVDLTYQYEVNGCDTGKHEFDSLAEYCEGLADDDLNNGCAADLREQAASAAGC